MSKEIYVLDSLDRRIIRELDSNARLSFADLASRLSIPAETARYRVSSMVDSGAIASFYTVIDAGQLGCSVHKGVLKLRHANEAITEEIISYIVSNPTMNWVVRMDNIYDIGFTMWVSSTSEVSSFVDKLKEKFHRYISKVILSVNVEGEFLGRYPPASGRKISPRRAKYTAPKTSAQIDNIDLQILAILGSNPRLPATAIGEKIGMTSETVAKRIMGLEKRGIIKAYRLVVDCTKVGEMNFYVLLYLNIVSAKRTEDFIDLCRAHPKINYLIKSLGEWDYSLNLEVESMAECRAVIMQLSEKFSDVLHDYACVPIGKIHKFMIMPPGVVDTILETTL